MVTFTKYKPNFPEFSTHFYRIREEGGSPAHLRTDDVT